MAGDWIKWQKGLTRKPEVIQIAARLNLSRHAVAGLLMEVWEWADDNVQIEEGPSGSCPGSVQDVSDSAPGFVRLGDSPAALFDATFAVSGLADAMTAVGWMIVRSGSLVFPKFGQHNGKSAKARALDASRKRAERQNATTSRPESVQNPSGSQPDKKRTREEKRREEKKEEIFAAPGGDESTNAADKSPPATQRTRKRNPLFDAIAEITGLDPSIDGAGSLIGKIAASLKKAERPYTPEEVREFGRRFHELCPHAAKDKPARLRPTPNELERYIGLLRSPPPPAASSTRPATAAYD